MKKSIESIWKEGFLESDTLIAPKLNDLYNQKSKHIVDKFKRMYKINLIVIFVSTVLMLVVLTLVGAPYFGVFVFLLFNSLVVIGKKELNKLEEIETGANSYQYLKAFDAWLKGLISDFTLIYRFFFPLFFLGSFLKFWFSSEGETFFNNIIKNNPDIYLIFGLPLFWFLGVLIFAVLLGGFGGVLFKIDMKLGYGRIMKKLKNLIADMEELRA